MQRHSIQRTSQERSNCNRCFRISSVSLPAACEAWAAAANVVHVITLSWRTIMNCPKCGRSAPDGSAKCPTCFAAFSQPLGGGAQQQPAYQPPPAAYPPQYG